MYKAVKTGQLAKLIEQDDNGVLFELEDGTEKRYSMSTFKRWWKLVEEEIVAEPVDEPKQEEPKPEPVVMPVIEKVEPKEEPKQEPVNEPKPGGLLEFMQEEIAKKGLAIVQSGYGYTVKDDSTKFSKVRFKFYPRKKFIKIRVRANQVKEIGVPYKEIKGDVNHVYIHLNHDSGVNRDIVKKIISKTL